MAAPSLRLIPGGAIHPAPIPFEHKLADHQAILQGYFDTYITRHFSDLTTARNQQFLTSWFQGLLVADATQPDGERQLLIWEAMEPAYGRQRIIAFSKGLMALELSPHTVQTYLGYLRRLFSYVLEYPYIPTSGESISAKYGPLDQPVLEYDYPIHVVDREEEGFVLTGDALRQFYRFVRVEYLHSNQKKLAAARDYTMIVVAGESGLRASEIAYLDALPPHRDLFYRQARLQTRSGKGVHGSGKRVRKTLFTPFAQQTVRVYEAHFRPNFQNATTNPALFLAETGGRISYQAMWRNLHTIVQAARQSGLDLPPKLSWHSLRKSFATNYCLENPGEIWVLMDLMGHLHPSTIHRYVQFPRSYYDTAINDYAKRLGHRFD
jgi:site-specific recombinase XerD